MRRFVPGVLMALLYSPTALAVVPAGFSEERYVSTTLVGATGAAWAPDGSGRLFVVRKDGAVQVVRTAAGRPLTQSGETLAVDTFATEPTVYTNAGSGLLGLAFDPNYVVNRFVYLFVTVSAAEQQIVRYTDVDGGADVAGIGTERTVILPSLPTRGQNQNGGGLAFGSDGKLYFGVGDLGDATGVDADLTSLGSKIGRANLDGTFAADNPFVDGPAANNDHVWARGFRNPFGLLLQPSTGKLWASVTGDGYEQVFLVEKGDHAGFDAYENNQPAGYITPKIAYPTNGIDTRNIVSATRSAGTVTITTVAAHRFRPGQALTLAGLTDGSFNGKVYVASVPSATTFTAAQAGANASLAAGGTATTDALGGSITRGTFYDATAFPAEYRGDFFFGDFNSGHLIRGTLSAANAFQRVDVWGSGFGSNIQVTTGNDGALYTLGHTGGVLRRISATAPAQRLIVANTTPLVPEGGRAVFTVSLALAPAADVSVTITQSGGDPDISVLAGSALTFTPTDWQRPQPVVLGAAPDADAIADVTHFDVSASGLDTEHVVATSIEATGPQLVLSTDTLHVREGGQATFTVKWSGPLPKATTVTVTRVGGDRDVSVSGPSTLSFTPANAETPQTVTISAAEDDDAVAGHAQISVAAFESARLLEVIEVDDDAPSPDAGPTDGGTSLPGRPVTIDDDEGFGIAPGLDGSCGCRLGPTDDRARTTLAAGAILATTLAHRLRRRRR